MLREFLIANRDAIMALTKRKAAGVADSEPAQAKLEKRLAGVYDGLLEALKSPARGAEKKSTERDGPTLAQAARGCGALAEAVAETARRSGREIPPAELRALDAQLDAAVVGFAAVGRPAEPPEGAERIGSFVHELRNALACAIVAHSLIKQGVSGAGAGGGTNAVLERNLDRMRNLLDRAFSEIRRGNGAAAEQRPMLLADAVQDVVITAQEEARLKGLTLSTRLDRGLKVNVDRNNFVSALANLVQNAIKFSKPGGVIWVRSLEESKTILIEVEDRCGGLPAGKAEELFRPFTQLGGDRTGLGLGLSISHRAVALDDGALSVRDLPGHGCVFTISLPKVDAAAPAR